MDPLYPILEDAFIRTAQRLQRDPQLALKRMRRQFNTVLKRPMREWCIVVRASDTRLRGAVCDPQRDFDEHRRHLIHLTGTVVREMAQPVRIPWPGIPFEEAASKLGRSYSSLANWVSRGALHVDRRRASRFPGDGKKMKPFVYADRPIDPNNFSGRLPHPVWGNMWEHLWTYFPGEYEQHIDRVPRFRTHHGHTQFHGWEWICPGRRKADGAVIECGRRCQYLYAPQTVWTLSKAIGDCHRTLKLPLPRDAELPDLSDESAAFRPPDPDAPGYMVAPEAQFDTSGAAPTWTPGVADHVATPGTRRFACKACWAVISMCNTTLSGWNRFISHISGGMMMGSDVPRPDDICPLERKKRVYRKRSDAGKKRGTRPTAAGRTSDDKPQP